MKIKSELRKRVEAFISSSPSYKEAGGFLFENRNGIVADFLPIPNISTKPEGEFKTNWKEAKETALRYAYSKRGYRISAFFHSHPEPCIMSAADLGAAGSIYPDIDFVTITPLKNTYSHREYIWYACRGIKPIKIEY
ncbi:MAG: hypothetical protein A4E42_00452 [Methanoregulaceae archaeon PtaU1.Bin222]|nr:MAG: hypothetical protein A4E42_00452 [Methanoregulaceae archaeon PtaU1.Bin222]